MIYIRELYFKPEHENAIRLAAQKNTINNAAGAIVLEGYGMYGNAYVNVSTSKRLLNPTKLGPVFHPHPHLPPATSLYNYWCANMVCVGDVLCGTLTPDFYARQYSMYVSKEVSLFPTNPFCWIWVTPDGLIKKYNLIEARQFFCVYYERIVKTTPHFKLLQELVRNGINLRICGNNKYCEDQSIEYHYLNGVFGHDMILYAMLTIPDSLPWHIHRTEMF